MNQPAVEWLRTEIEADLRAASIVGAGGFEPERWATEPPGQVNPAGVASSRVINAALGLDSEYSNPKWIPLYSWNRCNNEPPEADCRDSDEPVALVHYGRRQFEHICRQDPRNTVARCEAELAILRTHYILTKGDRNGDYEEFSVVSIGGANQDCGCVTCHYYGMGGVEGYGVCVTIRALASGYRHRAGYAEHWGER